LLVKSVVRECKSALVLLVFMAVATFNQSAFSKDLPKFPYSDDMNVLIIAKQMVYNGVMMNAYQFSTRKSESDVVSFYEDEWGTDEMNNILFGDWRVLAHRDGDHLFTVQIEQGNNLTTHGTLSVSPMFAIVDKGAKKIGKMADDIGKNFPVPNGSKFMSDMVTEDLGRKTRTLMFSNSKSISHNMDYYQNKMVNHDNWSMLPTESTKSKEAGALALGKNGQELNLSFVRRSGKTYAIAVSVK
jgi:hypothetical protein